ncbi:hemolysin-III related-domain-containing protein [Chytridium lagenaria]|nr:hemolysin-III related-domain-containing protein [Chytridium lagenaria]
MEPPRFPTSTTPDPSPSDDDQDTVVGAESGSTSSPSLRPYHPPSPDILSIHPTAHPVNRIPSLLTLTVAPTSVDDICDGPVACVKVTDGLGLKIEDVEDVIDSKLPREKCVHEQSLKRFWEKGRLQLYKFEEVPRYMQDNCYIREKYRSGFSYKENWMSLIHLHNESGNIWSHVLATFLFIVLAAAFAGGATFLWSGLDSSQITLADRAIVCFFFVVSAFTFWSSSLFHLHLSHSVEAYLKYGCLDYSGISASVCANGITILFYLFRCSPIRMVPWLISIVLINLVGVFGPLFKFWPTAVFRPYRAIIYIASAVISMAPIIHFGTTREAMSLITHGFAVEGFCLMLGIYTFGVVVYVGHLPERFAPGRFDVYFIVIKYGMFAVLWRLWYI